MTLNVRHGDRVHVRAAGPDAAAAVDAIIALLDAGEVPEPEPVSVSVAPARALGDNEIAGVCALPGVVLGTATHWRRRISEAAEQGEGRSGGKGGARQGAERRSGSPAGCRSEPPAVPQPRSLRRISACSETRTSMPPPLPRSSGGGVQQRRGRLRPMRQPPACVQRTACGFASGSPISTMLPRRLRVRCPERLRVREWTLARGRSCSPTSCCHPN